MSTTKLSTTPSLSAQASSSEAWTQGLAAGKQESLDKLVEVHFEPTLSFVRRSIADQHTAEDITQDVFLSVYASLERYDPSRALGPWIFTIASNKIRDHFRSRRFQETRRAASIEDGGADHVPSLTETPVAAIETRETMSLLRNAIDQLSSKLRSTVLLRLDQGLSFAAIGELLGSGEAAVRKRFSRALASLQDVLVLEPSSPCPDGVPCT